MISENGNWHSEEMARLSKLPNDALRYIMADCREAAEIGKDFNPKVGQYLDTVHYCIMELNSRK